MFICICCCQHEQPKRLASSVFLNVASTTHQHYLPLPLGGVFSHLPPRRGVWPPSIVRCKRSRALYRYSGVVNTWLTLTSPKIFASHSRLICGLGSMHSYREWLLKSDRFVAYYLRCQTLGLNILTIIALKDSLKTRNQPLNEISKIISQRANILICIFWLVYIYIYSPSSDRGVEHCGSGVYCSIHLRQQHIDLGMFWLRFRFCSVAWCVCMCGYSMYDSIFWSTNLHTTQCDK